MKPAGTPTPGWDRYCSDRDLAVAFENSVLYQMCRDCPGHSDPYVTAGKVIAIGRIYAASPERGAGTGRSAGSLAIAIARRLADRPFDKNLDTIDFSERFSTALLDKVRDTHEELTRQVLEATREWSVEGTDETWSPRRHVSFASKYLHFHRPNAFPIMDRFAKAGLICAGVKGPLDTYGQFCNGILEYVALRADWTPRSIDTELVSLGRIHSDRKSSHCQHCSAKFIKRRGRESPQLSNTGSSV